MTYTPCCIVAHAAQSGPSFDGTRPLLLIDYVPPLPVDCQTTYKQVFDTCFARHKCHIAIVVDTQGERTELDRHLLPYIETEYRVTKLAIGKPTQKMLAAWVTAACEAGRVDLVRAQPLVKAMVRGLEDPTFLTVPSVLMLCDMARGRLTEAKAEKAIAFMKKVSTPNLLRFATKVLFSSEYKEMAPRQGLVDPFRRLLGDAPTAPMEGGPVGFLHSAFEAVSPSTHLDIPASQSCMDVDSSLSPLPYMHGQSEDDDQYEDPTARVIPDLLTRATVVESQMQALGFLTPNLIGFHGSIGPLSMAYEGLSHSLSLARYTQTDKTQQIIAGSAYASIIGARAPECERVEADSATQHSIRGHNPDARVRRAGPDNHQRHLCVTMPSCVQCAGGGYSQVSKPLRLASVTDTVTCKLGDTAPTPQGGIGGKKPTHPPRVEQGQLGAAMQYAAPPMAYPQGQGGIGYGAPTQSVYSQPQGTSTSGYQQRQFVLYQQSQQSQAPNPYGGSGYSQTQPSQYQPPPTINRGLYGRATPSSTVQSSSVSSNPYQQHPPVGTQGQTPHTMQQSMGGGYQQSAPPSVSNIPYVQRPSSSLPSLPPQAVQQARQTMYSRQTGAPTPQGSQVAQHPTHPYQQPYQQPQTGLYGRAAVPPSSQGTGSLYHQPQPARSIYPQSTPGAAPTQSSTTPHYQGQVAPPVQSGQSYPQMGTAPLVHANVYSQGPAPASISTNTGPAPLAPPPRRTPGRRYMPRRLRIQDITPITECPPSTTRAPREVQRTVPLINQGLVGVSGPSAASAGPDDCWQGLYTPQGDFDPIEDYDTPNSQSQSQRSDGAWAEQD
ncbi:hypothetical protein KIPB_006272 [Kipferlia bialata]|uniref:Uncharacterized protein n=1 Tax=Kipferlia bialata TaxID=797122 RepID=A0A9K3CSN5_9EUKA|nr:hypothetical protein KIPB_002659 [Kipferlia bialata]GIQ83190.1 hypothetical protein KIPB_004467 [Kipferlia bialata]GIQ83386.1 hypothetical protein KIPB_004697 [Kipferlia bialata]GIQ84724.1 hypothetical protein KIPB_006272 [Kipferlia bialata]|eukprot:g2659.t1